MVYLGSSKEAGMAGTGEAKGKGVGVGVSEQGEIQADNIEPCRPS